MVRPVAVIVAAILMSRPGMPKDEATRFATVLKEVARQHGFDPLTGVAIVHFESSWYPEVVSGDGEDYGLGQIRARYIGACRQDDDPLTEPSEACQEVKKSLLDAETNLRLMGQIITDNRKLCRDKTGTAHFHQWLGSYQGLNFPKENRWCQANERTHRVVEYRKQLIAQLVHGKPAAPTKPKAPTKPAAKPKAPTKPAAKPKAPPKPAAKPKAPRKPAAKPKAPTKPAAKPKAPTKSRPKPS
ncbi:MAG: hypothetical protein KF718_28180 [Polyangiaceae bacterium]|nr:hypothetical protein [Polyangiaceae bacterium]